MKYNISDYRLKMEIEDGNMKYFENGEWKEIGGGSVVFLLPYDDSIKTDQEKIKEYNKKVWKKLYNQTTNPIPVYFRQYESNVLANPAFRIRYCSNDNPYSNFGLLDNRLGISYMDYGESTVTSEGWVYIPKIWRFYEDGCVTIVGQDGIPTTVLDDNFFFYLIGQYDVLKNGTSIDINDVSINPSGENLLTTLNIFGENFTKDCVAERINNGLRVSVPLGWEPSIGVPYMDLFFESNDTLKGSYEKSSGEVVTIQIVKQ